MIPSPPPSASTGTESIASEPYAAAIVVAAGSSTRMLARGASGERKPLLFLAGRTILERACAALAGARSIGELVVVGHAQDLDRLRELARTSPDLARVRAVVHGGALRIDSVRAGVDAVSARWEVLCVHDAARPLVEPETVDRAALRARSEGASLVAVPVRDTIKLSSAGSHAESTLDRARLWAAQTPQCFRAAEFRELLLRARAEGFQPTDDSALYERYVGPVPIVEGEETNLKITTPGDLALAEALLAAREREAAR